MFLLALRKLALSTIISPRTVEAKPLKHDCGKEDGFVSPTGTRTGSQKWVPCAQYLVEFVSGLMFDGEMITVNERISWKYAFKWRITNRTPVNSLRDYIAQRGVSLSS